MGVDGYLRPDQFLDHITVIIRETKFCFFAFSFLAVEDYVWFTGQHSPMTDSNCMFLLAVYEYAGRDHDCASSEYPICQLK